MPKNKLVSGLLDWLTEDDKPGKVSIDNKTLFESLAEADGSDKDRWYFNKRLRFLLVVSAVVMVLVSVVYYASAFINDVILFKTEMRQ